MMKQHRNKGISMFGMVTSRACSVPCNQEENDKLQTITNSRILCKQCRERCIQLMR